jgi:hypothetical protein
VLRLLITFVGTLRVNDSLNFKKAMDASIFSLNPCFVCNEETSFDDMVCEEDSFIPIQFKKVNEVFKKLKLCNVFTAAEVTIGELAKGKGLLVMRSWV